MTAKEESIAVVMRAFKEVDNLDDWNAHENGDTAVSALLDRPDLLARLAIDSGGMNAVWTGREWLWRRTSASSPSAALDGQNSDGTGVDA